MAPNTPAHHQQGTSGGHHPREPVAHCHTGHGHITIVNQHAVQAYDMTKFLKQHFKVPTVKPYKAAKLIRRTSRTCVGEYNTEKWRQNFSRRQGHLNDGFFTSQCEPYHPIGDIELDSKHMVLGVLSNCLPKKMPLPGIGFGGHRVTVSPTKDIDGDSRHKPLSPSGDKVGELDEVDLATAGFTFVKDYLEDTKELLVAGKGGQAFEKNVKEIEERKRQLAEDADTSSNAITFLPPEISHRDVTLPPSSHYQQHRDRSASVMSTESMKSTVSSASRTKPVDSDVELERMRLAFNRNRRAAIQKLDSIHKIMNALHNIKTRDLRTRVPLSHEAVKFMYREVPVSERAGLSRPFGATTAGTMTSRPAALMEHIQSTVNFAGSGEASSAAMHGGARQLGIVSGRLTSRSHLAHSRPSAHVRPQDGLHSPTQPMAWKKFGRVGGLMNKVKTQHQEKDPKLIETWEDLLAVQSASNGAGQHRLSVNPDKGYGMKTWMHVHHRHHDHPPSTSRQPYWLTVSLSSAEKAKRPVPVSADGITKDKTEPEETLQTIKDNFVKSQRKMAREIMTDLERMERERCRTFRQKFYSCDTSPLFEKTVKHMRHLAQISPCNADDHTDIEVKPSKWYTDLKAEAETIAGKDDPEVSDILQKLSRFCLEDSRSIPNAKEKLCLLLMSMPASQLLTIPMQQAMQFVMDNIILAPPESFSQWLQHRKIPQIIPSTMV